MTDYRDSEVKRLQNKLMYQLKLAEQTSEQLNRVMEKKNYPPEPDQEHDRFSIRIQFAPGNNWYEYLLLRVGKQFFTTGVGAAGHFGSWVSFIDWLRENAYRHSPMAILEPVKANPWANRDHVVFDANEYTE